MVSVLLDPVLKNGTFKNQGNKVKRPLTSLAIFT